MSTQSWLCTLCGREEATLFCFCSGTETLLCGQCLSCHFLKNPTGYHQNLPIAAHGQHRIPGYFERLQARSVSIPRGKEEALKNLELIDECMKQLIEKLEALIAKVQDYGQRTYEKLSRLREEMQREINIGVAEVESTMYIDNPALLSDVARSIRNYKEGASNMKFFTYSFDVAALPASFENMLTYTATKTSVTANVQSAPPPAKRVENAAPIAQPTVLSQVAPYSGMRLVGITDTSLRLYDLPSGATQSATLSVRFSIGTVFCFLSNDKVLCLGDKPEVTTTHLLDLKTFRLTTARPMLTARAWPGVVKVGNLLYVFGGNQPSITQCEKYNIDVQSWTAIRDMQYPRYAFSPSMHNGDIYLVDATQTYKVVEAFNVASEAFRVLKVTMNGVIGNSVSFFVEDELFLITSGRQLARWRLSETEFRVETIALKDFYTGLSNIQPVRVGKEVFWIRYGTGALVKFNIEKLALKE